MSEAKTPSAPLTPREQDLARRLLRWEELPPEFKAALTDFVSVNGSLHVSAMPTLKGEEWNEVGATGKAAFGTGWGNFAGYDTAAYYRDAGGIVRLKGLVAKSSAPAAGNVIFTLPEGYRPAASLIFAVLTGATRTLGEVEIQTDGDVVWGSGNTVAAGNFTSLNGITFRAA